MCGIFAVLDRDRPVRASELTAGLAELRHRGPDAQATWIASKKHVGLGHSRLSIIGLTSGGQPIANEDESIHIVVNGEFYDFERIRAELQADGHRFRTQSDSEIALHLYEQHGVGCLRSLRGEFAFALWDERQQLLFAARDRAGTKPLYYSVHEGRLYFASEVKAMFAAGVPARWNQQQVYFAARSQSMLNGSSPLGATLFEGVHQLPAGHYLIATPGGAIRIVEYWDFDYTPRAETPPFEQAVIDVRTRLDEAVRLRMRADVPVSCYLSAGVDAAAVLALSVRHAPRKVTAFTMTFEQSEYDEGGEASQLAAQLGADYQPIRIDFDAMADVFERTLWHAETWLWNTNALCKFLLSRGVHDGGYKVVLSGQGSDEIFGGYSNYGLDLRGESTPAPGASAHVAASLAAVRSRLGFVPAHQAAVIANGALTGSLLTDEFVARFDGQDANWLLLNTLDIDRAVGARDRVTRSMYLWNKTALADYILAPVGDRAEMANSVESRLPYLDHELIEAVDVLPTDYKIHQGVEKHLLREALRGIVPDSFRTRKKKPFLSPPALLQPGSRLGEMLRDIVAGPLPDFLDAARVKRFLAEMPRIEAGRFLVYTDELDRRVLEADLCLMFTASLCVLGRTFKLS